MRKTITYFITGTAVILQSVLYSYAAPKDNVDFLQKKNVPDNATFDAFTGKIIRNKVRLRLNPSLDGTIIRELDRGEMLLVIGEADEFYSVKPPQGIKAYVFRTFILDNTVEGKHVNVRLSPDLEAPIIAQFNSGDHIVGTISPLNSKWLEIDPPESVKFFVCKEYVENIGGPHRLTELQKRNQEVQDLVETAEEISQMELQKPFIEIHIEKAIDNINRVIAHYSDFPEQVARAKEQLNLIQDTYLRKKLAYLESKAQITALPIQSLPLVTTPVAEPESEPAGKLAAWIPAEQKVYEVWVKTKGNGTMKDFYQEQQQEAVVLTGILEPYTRHTHNKPGDYLLIAHNSRMPSAYLYSTQVDLEEKLGKEVSIVAIPRPNNNFAHPAYFVLSVE